MLNLSCLCMHMFFTSPHPHQLLKPTPLFAQFILAVVLHIQWLARRLSCSWELILYRLHLLVVWLFQTAEDWQLG